MDGANSDNESRSTSSFRRRSSLLEVLSRKKRKKKRWEFNPEPPIPVTGSSSSFGPSFPPMINYGVECRGWRIMPPSEDSRSSSPFSIGVLITWNHSLAVTKSHPSAVSLGSWTGYAPRMEKFDSLVESVYGSTHRVLCHLYAGGMPPSFFYRITVNIPHPSDLSPEDLLAHSAAVASSPWWICGDFNVTLHSVDVLAPTVAI
ncbi:hypothetical protein HPP92_001865 [Vanilla planifolia]|uniref:Uncharacterized protein n=1 Tax=Vanilla planifolia TaxID=51239 RepID=A0A835RRW8_VANPL|nr:hypothetical protein HPP92_002096 [Vanilla planifolia]KAG0501793.1 hypothetical protein HPP92_001865 [Vanilla planifolia]